MHVFPSLSYDSFTDLRERKILPLTCPYFPATSFFTLGGLDFDHLFSTSQSNCISYELLELVRIIEQEFVCIPVPWLIQCGNFVRSAFHETLYLVHHSFTDSAFGIREFFLRRRKGDKVMIRFWIPVTALLIGLPFLSAADTKPTAETANAKEGHSTLSKDGVKTCGAACCINFGKELALSLDYLDSLGHRISTARKGPDPVELALCSQALEVAETVSGKKAPITAAQIRDEAIDLAKQRGYSQELAALAMIVSDASVKKELQTQATLADKREKEELAALKTGEAKKDLYGTLTVANHSPECVRIYVSGRYKGEVHQGETASFNVHDHNAHTVLQAYCEDEGELVSNKMVFGNRYDYYWHIH